MKSKSFGMTLIVALILAVILGQFTFSACGDDDDEEDEGWWEGYDENEDVGQPDDDDNGDDDDEDDDDENDDDDSGDDDSSDDDDATEPGPNYAKDHTDTWNCYLCHVGSHGNVYNAPGECMQCHTTGDALNSKARDDIPHFPNLMPNCKNCHDDEHSEMFDENEMCTVCHQKPKN